MPCSCCRPLDARFYEMPFQWPEGIIIPYTAKVLPTYPPADRVQMDDPDGVFTYRPENYKPEHRWTGEGDPPAFWMAADGTQVYRSYADYVG